MNDCPNADVRDLLPDLMHGRLDAATRASVEAHVADCADCAAELALLRDLRAVRGTPAVDIASIVAAVPAYRAAPRRSWVGWRAAAAITVLVAGASSVAVLQRGVGPVNGPTVSSTVAPVSAPASTPSRPVTVATTPAAPVIEQAPVAIPRISEPTPVAAPPTTGAVRAERELAMGGGSLGDLDNRQLASLLKDIESLDAVPSVEVDNTPVSPIAPTSSSQASP
jgi:anti-sigma factor RsiW